MFKPRSGIPLAAALGAFVTATLMATATAPVTRADDPFTDIVAAVQGDFTLGEEAFTLANASFADGEIADGLAHFFGGLDDYLLSAPNNILQGSLAALLGEPVGTSLDWTIPVPADFNDAIIVAPVLTLVGLSSLSDSVDELFSGDIAGALNDYLFGTEYLSVLVPQLFIVGTVAGFGL